jgi:hypothetical protein
MSTPFVCLCPVRVRVRVRVTLQLTVSQSVSLGVEPNLGLLTRDNFFFKVTVLSFGGALSDERSGLSSVSPLSIKSVVVSMYIQFTLCVTHSSQLNTIQYNRIKNLHCVIHIIVNQNKIQCVQYIQASFSPGFAQQIMP